MKILSNPATHIILILLIFLVVFVHRETHRKTAQDKDFVQAIVGEASNQTEDTMICIAHALRNRGNLKGVFGYNAPHVWSENDLTWRKAWIAWEISGKEKEDPTRGAKNFGTLQDINIMSHVDHLGRFHGKSVCGDIYFY